MNVLSNQTPGFAFGLLQHCFLATQDTLSKCLSVECVCVSAHACVRLCAGGVGVPKQSEAS